MHMYVLCVLCVCVCVVFIERGLIYERKKRKKTPVSPLIIYRIFCWIFCPTPTQFFVFCRKKNAKKSGGKGGVQRHETSWENQMRGKKVEEMSSKKYLGFCVVVLFFFFFFCVLVSPWLRGKTNELSNSFFFSSGDVRCVSKYFFF